MKIDKQFEAWRAEEIAKVLLLNSGLVKLVPEYNDQFDFLAISSQSPDKKIAVEVKPTKSSGEEIKRVFNKTREQLSKCELPVLLMYVNSDSENGYFEVLSKNGKQVHGIQLLQPAQLESTLAELV